MAVHSGGKPNSTLVVAQGGDGWTVGADTNEGTLVTVTIPANLLGSSGQVIVETLWTHTNSSNNKSLRVRFGGTVMTGVTATTTATTQAYTRIANRGATNSQVTYASAGTGFGLIAGAVVTSAIDTTADVAITITGQKTSSGETIKLESYCVTVQKG
jgi:hypothetical protein